MRSQWMPLTIAPQQNRLNLLNTIHLSYRIRAPFEHGGHFNEPIQRTVQVLEAKPVFGRELKGILLPGTIFCLEFE